MQPEPDELVDDTLDTDAPETEAPAADPKVEITCRIGVVAFALDLTPRRIAQLVAEGVLPKSRRGQFDLVRCSRAYVQYQRDRPTGVGLDSLSAERARLTRSRADVAELEAARLSGDLIPSAHILRTLGAIVTVAKVRFRSIGAKLAPRLESMRSVEERKNSIDAEIDDALAELARAELAFDSRPDSRR